MSIDISKMFLLDRLIFGISVIIMMGETKHAGPGPHKDIEFCEVSKLTRTVVKNCPRTSAAVDEAAERKNCSGIPNTCLNMLEYHCVINPWGNLTVEVCTPATYIREGFCAEYNEGGGKIQEFHIKTCSACLERYWSTAAYKYPECYPKLIAENGWQEVDASGSLQLQTSSANHGFKASIFGKSQLFYIQMLLHVLLFISYEIMHL